MSREEIIDKYFLNIELNLSYLDLYYVRKSIFTALNASLPKFSGVLLDVGCGIMPYREHILSKNKNVSKYIGLDFENSIEAEYALGKPDLFWTGDKIPLPDRSVDTMLATEFFEHCPDPQKIMDDMIRVLKPGGILFLSVPFLWNLHIVPHDEYRYTPFALQRHLANAGFAEIEIKALGRWDASLAQMMALWHRQRPQGNFLRSVTGRIIKVLIKRLLTTDRKLMERTTFAEGDMVTGFVATAFKPR